MARVSELGAFTFEHQTGDFDCGVESINRWLTDYALQAQQSGTARTFVFSQDKRVIAFYALSTGSITQAQQSSRLTKGVGKHPIPVVLISRFGVTLEAQGQQLGRYLLQDALLRILHAADELGIRAVQVHAVNAEAESFYRRFGFDWIDQDRHEAGLYLLLKDVARFAAAAPKGN